MEDSMKTIGERLKEVREEKELTQRALMIRTGIAQKTISRIENGVGDTRISSVIKLAEALGLKFQLIENESVAEKMEASEN